LNVLHPLKLKAYAEESYAANGLLLEGILAIHPVLKLTLTTKWDKLSLESAVSYNILYPAVGDKAILSYSKCFRIGSR
jgi:hypothetical protein